MRGITAKIYNPNKNAFNEIIGYGAENNTVMDRLCAFFIALSPILQHYKGFYRNAGFSVLIIISPVLVLRLLSNLAKGKYDTKCLKAIVPLLLFQVYKIFDHTPNISKTLYGIFMIIVLTAIALGCVNVRYFVRYASVISVLAGAFLVVQYCCYYILGFHLQLVPTSLLLSDANAWILGVRTGLYGLNGAKNGFYRPCAFFLEPSHLFLYSFPVLCLLLFSPGMNRHRKQTAFFVALSMILSTSGMGVFIAAGLLVAYYMFYNGHDNIAKLKNIFSGKNIFILAAVLSAMIVAYFSIDVFQLMIKRIFSSVTGNSTAIDGRTRLARSLIQNISDKSFFIGITDNVSDITFNLPGFYATLYKHGIIGIFLSYLFYIPGIFKLKEAGFWTSAVILLISFFTAHTHGTFYLIYFVIVIMNGYHTAEDRKIGKIKSNEITGRGSQCLTARTEQ